MDSLRVRFWMLCHLGASPPSDPHASPPGTYDSHKGSAPLQHVSEAFRDKIKCFTQAPGFPEAFDLRLVWVARAASNPTIAQRCSMHFLIWVFTTLLL